MINLQEKKKNRCVLSKGQHHLLRKSLKRLLGSGLFYVPPRRNEREERALFLRQALNSKVLDEELLN